GAAPSSGRTADGGRARGAGTARSGRERRAARIPHVARRAGNGLGRALPAARGRVRREESGSGAVTSARAPSIARPNGTRLGQTASHARHWRQKPTISAKLSSTVRSPEATAHIAISLPLGEAVSRPVSR